VDGICEAAVLTTGGAAVKTATERPILFKPEMVAAILSAHKCQTRRPIKLPGWSTLDWNDFETDGKTAQIICPSTTCLADIPCPYGKVEDILWVRETWANYENHIIYRADEFTPKVPKGHRLPGIYVEWKPSIHMKRSDCRLRLQIIDIRIERLQDISEEDAKSEGIRPLKHTDGPNKYTVSCGVIAYNAPTAKETFSKLWAHIHGWESWETSPWVWVVQFKKL
jgi:hypothetical protein